MLMALLSIALIVKSLKTIVTDATGSDKKTKAINLKTVALTGVLILAFVLLMEPLGFIPTAALYLFVQFNVAVPKSHKTLRHQVYHVVAAIVVAIAINYLFVHGFDVLLPQGILEG